MKVYAVLFEPKGMLCSECSADVLGVFATEEKARQCIINEIENDEKSNEFVADHFDLEEFKKGGLYSVWVYLKHFENFVSYYILRLVVSEVE